MENNTDRPAKVNEMVRMLEQSGRWETIEVSKHTEDFWVIRGTRDESNLAYASIQGFISTLRSRRGRFAGGSRSSFASGSNLKTWRDFDSWSRI